MNGIKSYVLYIVISILTASFALILSSSVNGKSIKIACGLFIVCAFLYPLKNGLSDLNTDEFFISENNESEVAEEINQSMIKTAEFEIKARISEVLENMKIVYGDIETVTKVNDDKEIVLTKITVRLSEKYKDRQEEIYKQLRNIYNTESELIWETE